MAKAPAFQFYPQDFLVGTADMTSEEVGGFIRLLCYEWEKGSIPDNDRKIAQLSGCHDSAIISAIRKKFIAGEKGTLINIKLETVRAEQQAYIKRKAIAGGKGAQKRWQKDGSAISVPLAEHMAEGFKNDNRNIALLSEGEEEVIIKNGVAKIYKTESAQPEHEDLFEMYQLWADQVLNQQDPVFEQMLMREKMTYQADAVKHFLSILAQYPNKQPSTQQRFRTALIEEIKKYIKPKPVNGFQKQEAPAGPYIPPKVYEPAISSKLLSNPQAVEETIKLDIQKLCKNENFKPLAGAVKLQYLRKKKGIEIPDSKIKMYKDEAIGQRILDLNSDYGNLDNKKLLRDHADGQLTDIEKNIINVISQELAYLDWLKTESEKLKEAVAGE
jgi:uncharacterized protein YdaU (DUF1376 family)